MLGEKQEGSDSVPIRSRGPQGLGEADTRALEQNLRSDRAGEDLAEQEFLASRDQENASLIPQSPFLQIPESDWLCSNPLAFAINDGFPVSPGHVLVTTRRIVPTWFEATADEQAAMMALVNEVKVLLDRDLRPTPDGYNVGFNSGHAAGQTVPHVHIHVIPRYHGDVPDATGGVRHVIPDKANYLTGGGSPGPGVRQSISLHLSTGHPHDPPWNNIGPRLSGASEVDLIASFVQPSGLDVIQPALFTALKSGATIRVLVGDYLHITSPAALTRLLGWMELVVEEYEKASLQVRLAETGNLKGHPASFHPKAWRIADSSGGFLVVGSSNLSRPALVSGVEWNLIGHTSGDQPIDSALAAAFDDVWSQATPLDHELVARYAAAAAKVRSVFVEPEAIDLPDEPKSPRPWQLQALDSLARIRAASHRRALVAVATGMGKTWLGAFDILAAGQAMGRCPRVLVIAHRAEILVQAESTVRTAMLAEWGEVQVTWYLGAAKDMSGNLVVASIQKLSRRDGLAALENQHFDYAIIDEVHHVEAPTYRRVLARLNATFTLGLTATPERTDGVDVASIFDDVLAWQATIGDGIAEGALVPFHYLGLKDDIDFQKIPWRNGRFDPDILEEKLENSARMERLWTAWEAEPCARTLVFCCSRRHARFTRDWLRRRKVRAAAVFSGSGGDPRGDSLANFMAGSLEALCVVDLFNEGLDVPDVDRIVMLRPTESKVIFLQQLGRGLRATATKSHLKVIDFVGNHRVFATRLIHLLSLGNERSNWQQLKKVLNGKDPELPEGCLLELEIEAKDLLRKLVPTGGSAAVEAYRSMRDDLGRRPDMSELFHHGYLPRTVLGGTGRWFDFVAGEGDLSDAESATLKSFHSWLAMLETTSLNKSYKMIVLRVLLDHDAFWQGMEIGKLSAACREYILNNPGLLADLPPTNEFPDPANAPLADWTVWWLKWPLSRWMDDQAGRHWFKRDGDSFVANFSCPDDQRGLLEAMTAEVLDYRIAHYVRHRLPGAGAVEGTGFLAKVSHSSGNPILRVPTVQSQPGRPFGPTDVRLPDGTTWILKFVKIACNVAYPQGEKENQIADLLRSWFGEDAGLPGTNYQVKLLMSKGVWSMEPVKIVPTARPVEAISGVTATVSTRPPLIDNPEPDERFTQFVPVHSLEAAAGLWGPETSPRELGWLDAAEHKPKPGMFVAKVRGHSMEPKIPDGSWCLFRPCPAGSRQGRIVLVQFNSLGDPEDGGRFTVKKYWSRKSVGEDGWSHEKIQFLPLNPEYPPIDVEPEEAAEMIVVGELVAVLAR